MDHLSSRRRGETRPRNFLDRFLPRRCVEGRFESDLQRLGMGLKIKGGGGGCRFSKDREAAGLTTTEITRRNGKMTYCLRPPLRSSDVSKRTAGAGTGGGVVEGDGGE